MATCPEVSIETILGSECIGDSLPKINGNFSALQTAVCDLVSGSSSGTVTNVTGTTPIIITGTSTTTPNVTLDAAFIARLTTLENNMNNIGNYPYLEYAFVTSTLYTGQVFTSNASTAQTLVINTKVQDTQNIGLNPSSNIITLPVGTYSYEIEVPWSFYGFATNNYGKAVLYLTNNVTGSHLGISKTQFDMSNGGGFFDVIQQMRGTFNIVSGAQTIKIDGRVAHSGQEMKIGINNTASIGNFTVTDTAWTTRLKLWKVG